MWLLQTAIRQAFERAQANGVLPTAEQQLDYEARISVVSGGDSPRLLTIAGDTAEIEIKGAITNRPSMFAFMFGDGNTTFPDINAAIAVAEQDPTVKRVDFVIDSPGGTIAGLFDTLAAIQSMTKPTRAIVSNMAASAAFAIATQADEIIAGNRATRFGSVGIVVSGFVFEDEVTIASTEAPKKAPDIATAEGQAIVREELDAMHEIFVEAIAAGRSTTVERVNAEFGRGATLLAGEALERGMIDSISGTALSLVPNDDQSTASSGNEPEATDMDLNKLKAEHPAVYAAVFAEGSTQGVAQERERASAHLIFGEGSGDMATAIKAVQDGTEMTASLQATYMMAAANRKDGAAALSDDDAAAVALGSKAKSGDDNADAEAVVGASILSAAAASCSVKMEA